MARWLSELLPVSDGRFWGPLEPDRLGEHLIELVARDRPTFIREVLKGASENQKSLATTVLARIAERYRIAGQPDLAKPWYTQAARHGHHDAAFWLGDISEKNRDHDAALKWYQQAAGDHHLDAAFKLAELYERSDELDQSERWYITAGLGGHVEAAYRLGRLCWKRGRPRIAMPWFEWSADNGHSRAAYELGWIFHNIDKDIAQAERWWREAHRLDENDREPPFQLGNLLLGQGQAREAAKMFKRAADLGRDEAWAHYQRLVETGES
jgi:TPR repeat protein